MNENKGPPPTFGPREDVFVGSYDSIWRATQLAVQKYSIKINNYELGVIETEAIDANRGWTNPFDAKKGHSSILYRLVVKVIKGRREGKQAHKVKVLKEISRARDFFSDDESLPSDGWEEVAILYRIQRELEIELALQKAQNKLNAKDP